jgi:hypothetical protein
MALNEAYFNFYRNQRRCHMGKFAFFLTRVRFSTKSRPVKTYRPREVIEIGISPDDPPLGDEVYARHCVVADTEKEAIELGSAAMPRGK